ncbi:MAG: transposase [Candidatus Heimdallarchaeota archaeon]|nr:transposase [Candidatus Heimdallarchaeota archaeon]
MDLHDEEYYGKHLIDPEGREITMFGQLKNRSGNVSGNKRRVFRYATAAIVSFGKKLQIPINIAFAVNYKGQARDDVLQKIYEQIRPLNLKIECMVLDGGFASIRCFRFLDSQQIRFVSRGNRYKKRVYPDVEKNFEHPLRGSAGTFKVNGFIVDERSETGGRHRMLYLSSETITPKLLVKYYGKRFRIENSYRHARVSKIRTSTSKVHLRWGAMGCLYIVRNTFGDR